MNTAEPIPADGTEYRKSADLLEAELGDELLALDAEGGNCYGFNTVATRVWRLLDQPRTFAQLRETLMQEYDVAGDQCTVDLQELLFILTQRGLLERR
jgi:hypothetical protein